MVHRNLIASVLGAAMAVVLASGAAFSAEHHPSTALPTKQAWLADTAKAMKGSQVYVDRRVAHKKRGEKLAVNLDIDNTSIQTHYDWPAPVPRVPAFAKHAHGLGVTVLFNTGRRADRLKDVRRMLTEQGYPWLHVCGRHAGETLSESKQRCRKLYISHGYTLIANVGNNATDFDGVQDFGRAFRLPNYGGKLS